MPTMKPTEVRAFPGLLWMTAYKIFRSEKIYTSSWEKINDPVLCIDKKCIDNIVNILVNCSPLVHPQKEVNYIT